MKPKFHLTAAFVITLSAPLLQAATLYWDASPGVAGFGVASGTWSESTDPALNTPVGIGWSTSATGAAATVIETVTTTTEDVLNFGSGTALGAGIITVGTVSSGNILFGTGANGIILSGGTINLSAAPSITVSNGNTTQYIESTLAGAATSLTKAGAGILVVSGANTYTGRTSINAGRLTVSSIKSVGGPANALGQPVLDDATISIGNLATAANLTYIGTGDTTDRPINLAGTTGGAIIDHSGAGLLKFTSPFTATGAGLKTLVLQGVSTGTGEIAGAIVDSTSATALTKNGSAQWTLSAANTYTGRTTINSGTLNLAFGSATTDIISATSPLTLAGGTLRLTGTGTQSFDSLTTNANTASQILLGANQSLNLGTLAVAGTNSCLHINAVAGGANATTSTLGNTTIQLSGAFAGDSLSPGFTISDVGGFGLATVNEANQVIRQTTGLSLLPNTGANLDTNYRIDNNAGGITAPGSSSLTILTNASAARSITVDTTNAPGTLTLAAGVEFYNNIWHFGGSGANPFQIVGTGEDSGFSTNFVSETIFINNHNTAPVTFAANIKAFGTNILNLNGPGTTIFSGSNTYTGRTNVNSGTLRIAGGTSTIGAIFVGTAALEVAGGTTTLTGSTEMNVGLAGSSTFTITNGSLLVQTSSAAAPNLGNGGDLTINQSGGLIDFAPTGINKLLNIGVAFTGSATLNLSGGTFRTATNVEAYLGGRVPTVMNISGTATADIPDLRFNRNLNVPHTATLNLGDGTAGSGTLKTNSITKHSTSSHNISIFNFNGGTLQAGTSNPSFMAGLTTAAIQNGGAVIDTNSFDITIAQPLLTSPGATTASLTKIGAGVLTLSGINQYSGNTIVSAGTLSLSNAADPLNANPANDASTITIASDATLNLTYTGTDKVAALVIGATPLADGVYGKSGSPSPIIGIPQITGDGTITVGQSGFSAWISGSFANGTLPANQQGPNDDFDNDGISNLVEYAIAAQDPTVPNPNIGTFSSNTLSFTKRADASGITYRIEESTDLGITDDWQEVTGPSYQNLPNAISFTMTPGSPVRNFTRLRVTQNP